MQGKSFNTSRVLYDEWMGVYFKGKKIGYVHSITEEGLIENELSLRVRSIARIEMDIEGEKGFTELEQTGYLDKSGSLSAFEYKQSIMGQHLIIRGERKNKEVLVEINSGNDRRKKVFPFQDNLYTSGLMKHALLQKKLSAGEDYSFNLLLEPLLAVEPVSVRVLSSEKVFFRGRRTTVYTLEESFKGITGSLRLTAEGETLDETSPQGFKLLNVGKEEAITGVEALSITDLLLASRIEVETPIMSPGELKGLKLKLADVPDGFTIIEDGRQRVLATEKGENGASYLLEVAIKELPEEDVTIPVTDISFALYLKSDHVVNADSERIAGKARNIVGGERSALKAAEKIHRWVYKNIRKKLVDTLSAVDTLDIGEGECQAHSNLFAALARSQGIPTKIISGIVYSEEFEGFMYHAWNEVYVGEWVAVDSTLGGFPADVTHIKLAEGGLEEQFKIMALVGRVKVDKIEVIR